MMQKGFSIIEHVAICHPTSITCFEWMILEAKFYDKGPLEFFRHNMEDKVYCMNKVNGVKCTKEAEWFCPICSWTFCNDCATVSSSMVPLQPMYMKDKGNVKAN